MEARTDAGRRHLAIYSLMALAGLAILAAMLAAAALVVRYFQEVDYPGAARVSDHTLYRFYPALILRRDSSYRTDDPFLAVYHWYSNGFALGPEQHAQSGCILMARSVDALFVLESQMSVMLCDTPSGRLLFVMRSLALRAR